MRDGVAWLLFAATLGPAGVASAEEPRITAELRCESAPGPGRVRCELEIRPPAGSRLAWSDALVVEAPSFAPPLRSRVSAVPTDDGVSRATFALVATATGSAPLVVRARAVVCPADASAARCIPATREARLTLRVGAGP